MEIELSEDLQHYKESFILGLTVKQAFFSILALGTGTAVVLLLYNRIGVTLSCYVATPFVVPLALTGFYHYHGLTFWQFAGKMIHFAFFNRPLLYWSTESTQELEQIVLEETQREQKEQKKRSKKSGSEKNVAEEGSQKKDNQGKKKNRERNRSREISKNSESGGNRKIKKKRERNGDKKINKSREKNRNKKKNLETRAGKATKRGGNKSGIDGSKTNRRTRKKKGRSPRDMVTVVKRRKPAELAVVRVMGWILTLTALLAAGAAVAAVWYGQYR